MTDNQIGGAIILGVMLAFVAFAAALNSDRTLGCVLVLAQVFCAVVFAGGFVTAVLMLFGVFG